MREQKDNSDISFGLLEMHFAHYMKEQQKNKNIIVEKCLLALNQKEERIKVNLHNAHLGPNRCERIIDALIDTKVPATIDMSMNNIRTAGAIALAKKLAKIQAAVVISLRYNSIGIKGIESFLNLLKLAKFQITLDLRNNCEEITENNYSNSDLINEYENRQRSALINNGLFSSVRHINDVILEYTKGERSLDHSNESIGHCITS